MSLFVFVFLSSFWIKKLCCVSNSPLIINYVCLYFQAVRGQQIFTIYTFILGFAIPLFLILIFYAQVVFKLRTVGPKSNSAQVNGKTKSNRKKSHAKVTRLVLTVITVYIFCWFPYWITQLALIFANPKEDDATIVVAVNLLVCITWIPTYLLLWQIDTMHT